MNHGNTALASPHPEPGQVGVHLVTQDGRFNRYLPLGDTTGAEIYVIDHDPANVPPGMWLNVAFYPADPRRSFSVMGQMTYVWAPEVAAQHNLHPGYFITLQQAIPNLGAHLDFHPPPPPAPVREAPPPAAELASGLAIHAVQTEHGLQVQLRIDLDGYAGRPIEVFVPFPGAPPPAVPHRPSEFEIAFDPPPSPHNDY